MNKFFGVRTKTYSYVIDESGEDKKTKMRKKVYYIKSLNLKIVKTA